MSGKAVKYGFIGAGQGGSRIAEGFHQKAFYSKVLCVNTTQQDLAKLAIPEESKLLLGSTEGGAGKDMEVAKASILKQKEEVFDAIARTMGDDVEHIIVCVGSGGGSGGGTLFELIKSAKKYMKSLRFENVEKRVGVMVTLPRRAEGAVVKKNAGELISELLSMQNEISPIVLIDNDQLGKIMPGTSVKEFWPKCNNEIVSLFDAFNKLASKDSEYTSFDRADYRSIIESGLLIFGRIILHGVVEKTAVGKAVRDAIGGDLLAVGFDLTSATIAGIVAQATDEILSELPMDYLDYAFESAGRALSEDDLTLHTGIYQSEDMDGLELSVIIGGLNAESPRIAELVG